MRVIYTALLLSLLVGCAGPGTVAPREYLDEKTAATITVVADPWVFANDRSASGDERDFLNVYAIDVNRQGDHRQYLAVLQWWPPPGMSSTPTLELQSQDRTIPLRPVLTSARELGISQPLVTSHPPASKWWYFPVDKQILGAIARSQNVRATFVSGDARIEYIMWRDGRADVAELTDALQ